MPNSKELKLAFPNKKKWVIVDSLVYKFNVLFINQGFCYQELGALSKMQSLLLSKLATIEN